MYTEVCIWACKWSLFHITRNPEVGRPGEGSCSTMVLGGWLFLFALLFSVYGCPSLFMPYQGCPVVSGLLASSHLSPLFCQNKGVKTGSSGTYSRKAEALPEPPGGYCVQYTHPGQKARIIQFCPLLDLPHHASHESLSGWIPLPGKSHVHSLPSFLH